MTALGSAPSGGSQRRIGSAAPSGATITSLPSAGGATMGPMGWIAGVQAATSAASAAAISPAARALRRFGKPGQEPLRVAEDRGTLGKRLHGLHILLHFLIVAHRLRIVGREHDLGMRNLLHAELDPVQPELGRAVRTGPAGAIVEQP